MKRLIIAISALCLVSCGQVSESIKSASTIIEASPTKQICDKTVIDEQAGIAFETAYKAFRLVVETGVDIKLIKGTKATKLREINRTLFNITLAEQHGYLTCNATNYYDAIEQGKKALANGYKVLGE